MRTVGTALIALGLILAGCAAPQPPVVTPEAFDRSVSSAHVELYWRCAQSASGLLQVDGMATTRGGIGEVRFLELELVGVNDRDRTVSEARAAVPAIVLRANDVSPFRLELRPAGTEVRYDLYYQYQAKDSGRFSALDPAAVQLLAQQNQRFMARNACGAHRH